MVAKDQNRSQNMKIVTDAIKNTPSDYLEKTLQQRNPSPFSAGSVFAETQTEQSLIEAEWIPLQHNADAIKPPAIAYQANISGFTGIADIDSVDESLPAIIQPAHAGKGIDRDTGKLMAELVTVLPQSKMKTDFTTMIIGAMPDNPEKLQIWTFHPGAPVKPTDPIFMENIKETITTIKEAKKLGFKIVKHIPSMDVFHCCRTKT